MTKMNHIRDGCCLNIAIECPYNGKHDGNIVIYIVGIISKWDNKTEKLYILYNVKNNIYTYVKMIQNKYISDLKNSTRKYSKTKKVNNIIKFWIYKKWIRLKNNFYCNYTS